MAQYTKSALEEELKRPESLPVGWPWRLLLFMAIVFGITVAVYLGMTLGYKPYLNSQISTLDQKISQLSESIDEEQQKNLISFYSQLININNLIQSHSKSSNFFDFLEKNTSLSVYYNAIDLSLEEKKVKLEGVAPNYAGLAEQIELFHRAPEVEKISLDSSSVGDSGVNFAVNLILKGEIFK